MKNHYPFLVSCSALFAIYSAVNAEMPACPSKPDSCLFESGYGLCNDRYHAAYSAPSRFDVKCSWDFSLSGSLIYWKAQQEGMDLAYPGFLLEDDDSLSGNLQIQKFAYKPGFKVALGLDFDYDQWMAIFEYTWLHQQTHMTKGAPSGSFWIMTNWFNSDVATSFSSSWRAHIDVLDAALSRPFYLGRNLTIQPFGGVRAAWIRQNLHISLDSLDGVWVSHNLSHGWSAGARAGFQAHWLLGAGFRLEGDCAASALFMRYTKIAHQEVDGNGDEVYSLKYHDYNTLRPMADMNAGLGWGCYFAHQKYHVDLLATYDFNVMWGQNMMRSLVDTYNQGDSYEAGDLYLQGLTVSARFDF